MNDDRTRIRPKSNIGVPPEGAAPRTSGTGSSSWTDPSQWSETAATIEPGSVLNGRFVLEKIVGRGGMGVVFKARDQRKEEAQDRDPYVAIKILNDEFRRHPESLKALQREARKAQNLAHPNIATVFDFDRDGTTVYIQMEFLEGDSLDKLIKNANRGLPYGEAYPLIAGLGRALSYAHGKGIVHSDFKPGNCFLTKSGVIKVFDFGIARAAKLPGKADDDLTRFDAGTLGALTPAYASCEMLDGREPDARDDIYALGCVAYELLTGRHPFDKRSATEARDAGLVPAPVKGLNQRQLGALQKALAFQRERRSTSVAEFLEGLGEKKLNRTALASGLAAAGALTVAGLTFLPNYLEERQIERLVAELGSGAEDRIVAAIERYRALSPAVQNAVLQSARDPLLEYFGDRIADATDRSLGRYDYPLAETLLATAVSLIPDSAILSQLAAALESDKNELLLEMRTQFDEHMAAGRLLPLAGPDNDVVDVLEIVAQASPDDPLLDDPRLMLAYANGAESALAGGELVTARELLDLGLNRYPGDARLGNLREQLDVELQSRAVVERLAELRERLEPAASLESLAELRALEESVTEFEALLTASGESDPLLDEYRGRFASLLDTELSALVEARDWTAADALIDDVVNLLTDEALQGSRLRIADARIAYEQRRDTLVADLNTAADEGRLDAAIDALAALDDLDADARTLQRGRGSIERAYVRIARAARAENRLDAAAELVAAGLAMAPQSSVLLRERTALAGGGQMDAIDADDASPAPAQAEAERDREAIELALAEPALDIETAERTLEAIDRLAAVAPGDPLVSTGRGEVAARLAEHAGRLGAEERFDEALALVDDSLDLVSEAAVLRDTRDATLRGRSEFLAARLQGQFTAQREALDALLEAPRFDADWEARAREALASLARALPAGDPTVPEARERIAASYIARAAEMRERDRLAEADRLLGVAAAFAPRLETLARERDALAEARRRIDAENAAQVRFAQIEGRQQMFLTAANANNIDQARAALDALRADLPADDPFLTVTAPRELAGILLRQAQAAFAESRLEEAARLAEEGLSVAPGTAVLEDLLAAVREGLGASVAAAVAAPAAARPTGQACTASLAGFGSRGTRGQCWDMLDAETQGPRLVIVPAGGSFDAPFAIGRYEIALGRWNAYCRLSGRCEERAGGDTDPLTGVSLQEARDYAGWLSTLTGSAYRLPTDAEWTYAASAPRDGRNDDNCVVASAGRGGAPRSVTQGQQNGFGLVNYQGNVQEWVETAAGAEARGGTYRDSLGDCVLDRATAHDGTADDITGFRLARDL